MSATTLPPLLVLAGPTASGKSEVGILLAEALQTEIISADSVQLYRHFDIGSAKPTPHQQAQVRHHLIDVADPAEDFTLARYREMAEEAAIALWSAGKIPLVVGGSGLYIKALIEGLSGAVKVSDAAKQKVAALREEEGQEGLYRRAVAIDPVWMAKVHPNDIFRIERVVGVSITTGRALSAIYENEQTPPPRASLTVILTWDKEEQNLRIDRRVDQCLAEGWRDEVQGLVKLGYNKTVKPMRSLGYRTIMDEFDGLHPSEETAPIIRRETRRYAKRQRTWFKAIERGITIPVASGMGPEEIKRAILQRDEVIDFLARYSPVSG